MRRGLTAILFALLTALVSSQTTTGPQPGATCPAKSVALELGSDIPSSVAAGAAGTTFCVKAGVHVTTAPINMKARQSLVGEYGAVINGAKVTQDHDTPSTSIIRGWNCGSDCSGVTIRNLVIRGLHGGSMSCIGVYGPLSGNWTIDRNELTDCDYGVNIGYHSGTVVTSNWIHHNRGNPEYSGGYGGNHVTDVLFAGNRFEANNRTQKVTITARVTFRDNVCVGEANCIWFDGDNLDAVIERTIVDGCLEQGIFYEISGRGVIRENDVRNCGDHGIFISGSRDVQVTDNRVTGNGIALFINCANVYPPDVPYPGAIGWDLRNNTLSGNRVTLTAATQRGVQMSYTGCTSDQLRPYVDGSKNLVVNATTYTVPNVTGRYWAWGDATQTFSEWQKAGRDTSGVLNWLSPVPAGRIRK